MTDLILTEKMLAEKYDIFVTPDMEQVLVRVLQPQKASEASMGNIASSSSEVHYLRYNKRTIVKADKNRNRAFRLRPVVDMDKHFVFVLEGVEDDVLKLYLNNFEY